jgi:hypothetical protein
VYDELAHMRESDGGKAIDEAAMLLGETFATKEEFLTYDFIEFIRFIQF